MSDEYHLTCPVCGRTFAESDKPVVCPVCGAPHHRTCWKKSGQCHYTAQHGTPEQWKKPPCRDDEDSLICGNCGCPNTAGDAVCRKCRRSLSLTEHQTGFPPKSYPGLSPIPLPFSSWTPYEEDTFDGQPVGDLIAFMGEKAGHYLSRFQLLRDCRGRLSWNWAAFLFPLPWLAFRKMFRPLCCCLLLTFLFTLPAVIILFLTCRELAVSPEAMQAFIAHGFRPNEAGSGWLYTLYSLSPPLFFLLHMTMGGIGDILYRRHVVRLVAQIALLHPDSLSRRYPLVKKGGTSVLAVLLTLVLPLSLLAVCFLLIRLTAWPIF